MREYFFVGTYTEPILFGTGEVFHGKGEGVYFCAFEDGRIEILDVLPVRNPSYLCINEEKRRIYAVNELKEYRGELGGGISELAYDASGNMELCRSLCTGGMDPCHVAMDPAGTILAVSNFASGSVSVFRLGKEGELLGERTVFQHQGSGPDPLRQRGPHAHSAVFCPGGGFLVPDLGIDALVCYRYDGGTVRREGSVRLAPRSGPRFGEFSSDGAQFYLINELASSVTRFAREGGGLKPMETLSTLPEGFSGANICSDLHIAPNGGYLYASNRGHDSIAAFRTGPDGELELVNRFSSGGKTPRNFALDPSGTYLLAGNQDSDTIAVFRLSAGGGAEMVAQKSFPTPVCIRFLRKA